MTNRTRARSRGGNVFVGILLLVTGAFMAVPLVYIVASAFKPFDEIFLFPPRLLVMRPTTDNFRDLFILTATMWVPFFRYVLNSVFVTVTATVLHVVFSSLAAFPLAKREFPFKNLLFSVAVLSLMFVPQVTFLPQYIVVAKLGWLDSYLSLILPPVGAALGLFLMKQFMEQIPASLLEAARIDGAGEYRIYALIVMPIVRPAWITLIIFSFQSIWSNTSTSFIFSEQMKLLPTALSQIASGNTVARMGVGMAATVVLIIPPVVLFICLQNQVIETMASAGIKE